MFKKINFKKLFFVGALTVCSLIGIKSVSAATGTLTFVHSGYWWTRTCFNSDFINQLINMNVSVVPIYDENNKIHLRIAVQDKKTNKSFIKVMNKIIKCDNIKIGG